jgi:hypothetical protein
MNDDLQVNKTGFSINLDWATAKRIFAWVRTTVITLGLGAGGWHGYTTNVRLADCERRMKAIEKSLNITPEMVPGPYHGGPQTGPPPVKVKP